jgi:hypothetical protein
MLQSLWALPTTSLGLVVGTLCTPFGTRWQRVDGVFECHSGAVAWLLEHVVPIDGGALALTLGEVVLGRTPAALEFTREHERVHVRQCRRWGPFFIPAYFAASGIAWLRRKNAYRDNAFEVEAYAVSDARRRSFNP